MSDKLPIDYARAEPDLVRKKFRRRVTWFVLATVVVMGIGGGWIHSIRKPLPIYDLRFWSSWTMISNEGWIVLNGPKYKILNWGGESARRLPKSRDWFSYWGASYDRRQRNLVDPHPLPHAPHPRNNPMDHHPHPHDPNLEEKSACYSVRRSNPRHEIMTSNSPTILRESQSISIANGDLQVTFLDNGKPSQIIGGASGLLHRNDASNTSAFNPTCDIGLSFEHIISGHRSQHNLNEARTTPFVVSRLDANSVQMQWKHQDSPWGISSTQKFTVVDPHYIDIDCRFVLENKLVFGNHGYAILFFCNYMNNVEDIALHFRGVEGPNQPESWVRADGPQEHPDWLGGGTYRSLHASDLNYDANHDSKFNCWSYDYPRFTKPFYFGKAGNGMVFMIMFDKLYTEVDEIRFSLFKFDVDNIAKRPAWDFQYVIRRLEEHRTFGFKARVVWKRFVSPDDCLNEYETWVAKNHNASKSRNTSRTRRTIAKHSNKTNP